VSNHCFLGRRAPPDSRPAPGRFFHGSEGNQTIGRRLAVVAPRSTVGRKRVCSSTQKVRGNQGEQGVAS